MLRTCSLKTAFALQRVFIILLGSRDPRRDLSDSLESFTTDGLIYYLNSPKYRDKVQIHVPGEVIKNRAFNL